MAEMPKDIKITVTPVVDTDAMAKLQATIAHIGAGFAETAKQMKPVFDSMTEGLAKINPFPKLPPITPEQIAHAYGVPPEMVGLLPPDAGETITQAVMDGTLTGEAYVYAEGGVLKNWPSIWKDQTIHAGDDTGVLEIGQCPTNTSPYVPGHLGINSMLVAQQPTGWEGKTSKEILADIKKVMDIYKGKSMPKKTFGAKEPGEGSGIPAHAVFTSPLIHTQEEAKAAAQQALAAFNPDLMTTAEIKLAHGFTTDDQPSFAQAVQQQAMQAQADAEVALLAHHIGVDIGPDTGNTIEVWSDPATLKIMVKAIGPDGEEIKTTGLTHAEALALAEKMQPAVIGTSWHEGFVDLGHTEAVAEALKQKKAVDGLQGKIAAMQQPIAENVQVSEDDTGVSFTGKLSNHASGTALDFNIVASGGFMAPPPNEDQMHFEIDPGPGMNFPEITTHKGGMKFVKPPKADIKVTWLAGGKAAVELYGTVVSAGGWHEVTQTVMVEASEAKILAGITPAPPGWKPWPAVGVAGEIFAWHPTNGWEPLGDDVSTGPATWFGEDGQPLPAEDDMLFDPEPADDGKHWEGLVIHPEQHAWCLLHQKHWADPMHQSQNLFECGSSEWTRPSTPVEDKAVLAWIKMLGESGLAVPQK